MAGGAVLFGVAYLSAVVSGSIYLSGGPLELRHDPQQRDSSYFLGPLPREPAGRRGDPAHPVRRATFISALAYRDPAWSINWALVDGVAQVAGLTMMVYAGTHPRKVPVYGRSFQVLPYGGTGSGGLRAVGRF